jgi:hypothetical protein
VVVNAPVAEPKRRTLHRPSVPPPAPPPPQSEEEKTKEKPLIKEEEEKHMESLKSDIEALYDSIADELCKVDSGDEIEKKQVKPVMEVKPYQEVAPVKPKSPPRPPPPNLQERKKEAPPRPKYSPTDQLRNTTVEKVTTDSVETKSVEELPKLTLQEDSQVKRQSLVDLQRQISVEVANWKKTQSKADIKEDSRPVIPPKPDRLKPPYRRAKSESNLQPQEVEIKEIPPSPRVTLRSKSVGAIERTNIDSLVASLIETDVDDGGEIVIEEVLDPPADFKEVEMFVDEMYEQEAEKKVETKNADESSPERSYGLTILTTAADVGRTPKIMLQYKDAELAPYEKKVEKTEVVIEEKPVSPVTPKSDQNAFAQFFTPAPYNSSSTSVDPIHIEVPSIYSQAQISPLSDCVLSSPSSDTSHLRFYTPAKFMRKEDSSDNEVKYRPVRPVLDSKVRDSSTSYSSDEGSSHPPAFKFSAPRSSDESGSDCGLKRTGGSLNYEPHITVDW